MVRPTLPGKPMVIVDSRAQQPVPLLYGALSISERGVGREARAKRAGSSFPVGRITGAIAKTGSRSHDPRRFYRVLHRNLLGPRLAIARGRNRIYLFFARTVLATLSAVAAARGGGSGHAHL